MAGQWQGSVAGASLLRCSVWCAARGAQHAADVSDQRVGSQVTTPPHAAGAMS